MHMLNSRRPPLALLKILAATALVACSGSDEGTSVNELSAESLLAEQPGCVDDQCSRNCGLLDLWKSPEYACSPCPASDPQCDLDAECPAGLYCNPLRGYLCEGSEEKSGASGGCEANFQYLVYTPTVSESEGPVIAVPQEICLGPAVPAVCVETKDDCPKGSYCNHERGGVCDFDCKSDDDCGDPSLVCSCCGRCVAPEDLDECEDLVTPDALPHIRVWPTAVTMLHASQLPSGDETALARRIRVSIEFGIGDMLQRTPEVEVYADNNALVACVDQKPVDAADYNHSCTLEFEDIETQTKSVWVRAKRLVGQCSDGVDNDRDGVADEDDPDCDTDDTTLEASNPYSIHFRYGENPFVARQEVSIAIGEAVPEPMPFEAGRYRGTLDLLGADLLYGAVVGPVASTAQAAGITRVPVTADVIELVPGVFSAWIEDGVGLMSEGPALVFFGEGAQSGVATRYLGSKSSFETEPDEFALALIAAPGQTDASNGWNPETGTLSADLAMQVRGMGEGFNVFPVLRYRLELRPSIDAEDPIDGSDYLFGADGTQRRAVWEERLREFLNPARYIDPATNEPAKQHWLSRIIAPGLPSIAPCLLGPAPLVTQCELFLGDEHDFCQHLQSTASLSEQRSRVFCVDKPGAIDELDGLKCPSECTDAEPNAPTGNYYGTKYTLCGVDVALLNPDWSGWADGFGRAGQWRATCAYRLMHFDPNQFPYVPTEDYAPFGEETDQAHWIAPGPSVESGLAVVLPASGDMAYLPTGVTSAPFFPAGSPSPDRLFLPTMMGLASAKDAEIVGLDGHQLSADGDLDRAELAEVCTGDLSAELPEINDLTTARSISASRLATRQTLFGALSCPGSASTAPLSKAPYRSFA